MRSLAMPVARGVLPRCTDTRQGRSCARLQASLHQTRCLHDASRSDGFPAHTSASDYFSAKDSSRCLNSEDCLDRAEVEPSCLHQIPNSTNAILITTMPMIHTLQSAVTSTGVERRPYRVQLKCSGREVEFRLALPGTRGGGRSHNGFGPIVSRFDHAGQL